MQASKGGMEPGAITKYSSHEGQHFADPQVLFMAEYNLEANFGAWPELRRRFRLRPLRWGDAELILAGGQTLLCC